MDVAKYTGLFLLKNHFCYIQGLGNLELKKRPATYDGQALYAPSYEVVLTPAGSVDDSLANFIASSELISISKAISALQDFSLQAKADLKAGKEVIIPSIGKFVEVEGKVKFVTDPRLQYTTAPMPATRTARRVEEPVYQQQQAPVMQQAPVYQQPENNYPLPPPPMEEGRRLNWGRVFLVLFVLIVLCAGGILAYRYIQAGKHTPTPVTLTDTTHTQAQPAALPDTTNKMLVDTTKPPADTTKVDTATGAVYLPESNIAVKNNTLYYKVILNKYYTRDKAEKRIKQLKTIGIKKVELLVEDSINFYVLLPLRSSSSDTARILDSLSRLYNPNGVSIY